MLSDSTRTLSDSEPTLPGSGAELGSYQLVRRLGAGGMGQVFAARSRDGELVALKQLALTEPTLLYRFKREFRSLADLPHPNLVRLGELVVLESGIAFFTMELVEGQPLVRWVRQGTPAGTAPNLHRVGHALRQLADAVAHLHGHARLHRDLKPSNVHVTTEGRVVVLDFGLVFEISGDDARITATGQLVGTPAYMAPEQGSKAKIGPGVDLYAIGVMLFECLTGCMPFVGSAVRVLIDKQHEPAPDPRELAEGIPDWIAQLCRALLDVDPTHRPTPERILAVLDEHGGATPLRVGVDDARGPELVGRERELELLARALAETEEHGRATVVRLSGPPGRGKSAVIEHFLVSARNDATVVLRGRCHPRESVPFKGVDGVIDALARHLRSLPEVDAAALRPRHVRELCDLFPVLGGTWADSGRRVVEREPIMRRRLGIEALREVLARIADAAPLIVVIDDFHWADLDSVGVLRELLLPPLPPAMLLILALDEGEGAAVGEAIRSPDTLRGATAIDIALAPLDPSAAEQLARALLGPREVDLDVAELIEACSGEPLALVRKATVRDLDESSPATDADLLRRVRALEPAARLLLEIAAVAAAPLANELVRAALGQGLDEFERAARALVDAGLLGAVALEDRGLIRLARPHVGEVVHVELDSASERRLHLSLAEALAEHGADAELIAEHFVRAGERERGREFMTAAARAAADALAFVRAEQLYRRALELLGADASASERRDLRLALADQLVHLARCFEAAGLYVEIADEFPPEQAAKLRLRAAEQYTLSGWVQLAVPLLRDLMHDAGEHLPLTIGAVLRTFARNQLRLWLHRHPARTPAPGQASPQQLARFDLVFTANMALSRREILPSLALRPRVMLLALEAGEPGRLALALTVESALLMAIGRTERAWQILARARTIAEPLGDMHALAYVHATEHFFHAQMGRLAEAEASRAESERCLDRVAGESWIRGHMYQHYAVLVRRNGQFARLRSELPAWISLLRDRGQRQFETLLMGEEVVVLAHVGDRSLARRSLERAREGWQLDTETFVDTLLDIAEIVLSLAEGRHADARAHAERMVADARRRGAMRFALVRARVVETAAHARLANAIALDDPRAAPSARELRRLRRSRLPKFATTGLILSAGAASLLGDRSREQALWRQALERSDAHSLRGLAAAVRRRLVELEVDDAPTLDAEARAYFDEQAIEDTERFVDLVAPAKRSPRRTRDPSVGS